MDNYNNGYYNNNNNENNFNKDTSDSYRYYSSNHRSSYYNGDYYDDLKTSSFYNETYKKPSRGKLKGLIIPLIVVALISSLLTGGIVAAYFTSDFSNKFDNQAGYNSPTLVNEGQIKRIEIVDTTTSAETVVAEKVSPSIVGISVTYRYSDGFFGSFQNKGSGSGIIYRSDGYILTNNHVIESAMAGAKGNKIAPGSKIQVILPNQIDDPYDATVIGRDSRTDIAILKINASELPAAEFGDSDKLKIGEKAIAIGNPAGLEFMGSVTSGIISGLNRKIIFDDGKSMRLIQTDAAINPGNSGGALLNSEGKVIGVNSSKIGGVGYEGLGFAIPSNTAREVAESIIKSGYVTGRPQLGIMVDTRFNKELAEEKGVPEGILVYDVEPLSGAYKAGIKSGDIITKFNGVSIKSFDELEAEKNKYKAGDVVEITLYRMPEDGPANKGETLALKVTLGEDRG